MAVVSAPHSSQHSSQQSSPKQDQVWLVTLDPTQEVEIQKTRPCLVISPDEMNQHLRTVIIAPMTTVTRPYPTRVGLRFQGKQGQVALDQLRAVDRQRLVRRLGKVSPKTAQDISATLLEMFTRT
jgi:mRNA interferase MazF